MEQIFGFSGQEFVIEIQNERHEDVRYEQWIKEEKRIIHSIGKEMIDIYGNRVRIEAYLLKPAPNQIKVVNLNFREGRLDWGYGLLTINKDLPDIDYEFWYEDSTYYIWKRLIDSWASITSIPRYEYYVTEAELFLSNTKDYIKDIFKGGYLVENLKNINWDGVFLVFREFTHEVNGVLKLRGERISDNEAKWTFIAGGNIEYEQIYQVDEEAPIQTTIVYGDGTWEKWNDYAVKDNGEIVPIATSGTNLTGPIPNRERIVEASEFEGRKIDMVTFMSGSYFFYPDRCFPEAIYYKAHEQMFEYVP